jgi:hypothetical protein
MSNYVHSTGVSGDSLITALFEGYGHGAGVNNPGNFINKGDPGYDESYVKQTVAGILDIQGTSGDTQAQAQAILDAAPQGANIKDLLQNLATTSAADIQQGTYQDPNKGHTYLQAVAAGTQTATVEDLYTHGLMRTADQSGLDYWNDQTKSAGADVDIQDIAKSFLASSESQTHQAFDKYFGKMAGTEGLDYFAGIDTSNYSDTQSGQEMLAQGQTLSDYIGGIIGYTGGTFNPETGRDWDVSAETIARTASYELAGEASTADQRNSLYYTAPKQADIDRYRDSIRDARADGSAGTAAITAVKDEIFNKADQLLGANQGDFDDLGGIAAGNATGMGRFLSDAEQQKGFEEGKTGQDWYDETKGTVWGPLKGEVDKTTIKPEDIIKIKPDGTGGKIDTEVFLEERAKDPDSPYYDQNFDINDYRMWNQKYLDEGGVKYDHGEWTYNPVKPDLPTDIPIKKEKVDYMPGFTSDVQLPSDVKYADRAKEFQTEYDSVPGTAKTAQGTAGQRFTGTSAKGVRMKRSKASRMGTIRGTKQLGREQQTKSLNI